MPHMKPIVVDRSSATHNKHHKREVQIVARPEGVYYCKRQKLENLRLRRSACVWTRSKAPNCFIWPSCVAFPLETLYTTEDRLVSYIFPVPFQLESLPTREPRYRSGRVHYGGQSMLIYNFERHFVDPGFI